MRQIKTKQEIKKKSKKNQIIVSIILVSLLVLSYLGYSLSSRANEENTNSVNYNNLEFIRSSGFWLLQIQDKLFYFQYLPEETINVSISTNLTLENYYNKPLYFVNSNPGAGEILNNLKDFVSRYQEACKNNTECVGDLPVKTCEDNLIIFIEGKDLVYQDQNCIYVSGNSILSADAFVYKLFEII